MLDLGAHLPALLRSPVYLSREKTPDILYSVRVCRHALGQPQGGLGGLLGNLGGAGVGGLLGRDLNELVERFQQSGQGDIADSWVGHGPNKEVAPNQLEQAIGPDVLATLSQQTGLSREEILAKLSKELPTAVDKYTPEGRLPSQQEL